MIYQVEKLPFLLLQKIGGISTGQAKKLYYMDFDNWKSTCTRNSLLWGECAGNTKHEHFFIYMGTPDKYKLVIINNDTGETKVSDIVNRRDFTSYVTIDYNTMKVKQNASISDKVVNIIMALVITIVIEIFIGLIMKMKNTKIIIATNLVSNIILQLILILVPVVSYLLKFIFMEILVVLFEFLIYKKFMKNQSHNKILLYTLIANVLTAFLTFIF